MTLHYPILKNKASYCISHLLDLDLVSCHTLLIHISLCVRMGKKGLIILVIILQYSTFSVGPVQDLSLLPFCGSYWPYYSYHSHLNGPVSPPHLLGHNSVVYRWHTTFLWYVVINLQFCTESKPMTGEVTDCMEIASACFVSISHWI